MKPVVENLCQHLLHEAHVRRCVEVRVEAEHGPRAAQTVAREAQLGTRVHISRLQIEELKYSLDNEGERTRNLQLGPLGTFAIHTYRSDFLRFSKYSTFEQFFMSAISLIIDNCCFLSIFDSLREWGSSERKSCNCNDSSV